MVQFIRRSALVSLAAILFLLAPAAQARVFIPFVRFHHPEFFNPARANLIIRDRSNLGRDRVNLFNALRTHNPTAALRDRSLIFQDSNKLIRDGGGFFPSRMGTTGNYMMGGYGGGGGGYGGGGGGYGGGGGGGTSFGQMDVRDFLPQQPQTEEPANFLDALGVPNSGMHIDWPLGLRVLPPESRELQQQIEGLLLAAANQLTAGPVDKKIVDATSRAVRKLRGLLADLAARDRVAPSTTSEASAFLDRLQRGVQLLQ